MPHPFSHTKTRLRVIYTYNSYDEYNENHRIWYQKSRIRSKLATKCHKHFVMLLGSSMNLLTIPKLIPIKKGCTRSQMNYVPMHLCTANGLLNVPKAFRNVKDTYTQVESEFWIFGTKFDGSHCIHHRNCVSTRKRIFRYQNRCGT